VIVHDRQGQFSQVNEALFRLSTVILGANTHVRHADVEVAELLFVLFALGAALHTMQVYT
jgi:hypothetical protein